MKKLIIIYAVGLCMFVWMATQIKPPEVCPEVKIEKPVEIPKPVFVPPDQREEVKRLKAQLRKINTAPALDVKILAR